MIVKIKVADITSICKNPFTSDTLKANAKILAEYNPNIFIESSINFFFVKLCNLNAC